MWNTKACVVCLNTNCVLYTINAGPLLKEYCDAAGCNASDLEGMPHYLCVECAGYVKSFKRFREKCRRAQKVMIDMLHAGYQITESTIQSIDREKNNIAPYLALLNLKNVTYDIVNFPETFSHTYNPYCISDDDTLPVFYLTTDLNEPVFDVAGKKPRLSIIHEPIKEEINDDLDLTADTNTDPSFQFDAPLEELNIDEKIIVEELKPTEEYGSDDDGFNDDVDVDDNMEIDEDVDEEKKDDDKSTDILDQEYADIVPITAKEAKAVMKVSTMFSTCPKRCSICGKGYQTDKRLKNHMRIHDQHTSGTFKCEICFSYYKTQYLLDTHLKEKHLFKYLCKKCDEVSYDRVTAKQHYIRNHMWGLQKRKAWNWHQGRPKWLSTKGVKRRGKKEKRKVPKPLHDYPKLIPVSQEDQYRLVQEKKHSKNYLESKFKCDLCYKGFLTNITYEKHMKCHDPTISGKHQCDMCKMCFKDQRKIYAHVRKTHLLKYACQMCDYVCSSGNQARVHYQEHKNVTHTCQHCNEEFKKTSTLLTHIRVKHPSTYMCVVCGHSFVSEYGVHVHMNRTHTPQEIEESKCLKAEPGHPNYCAECNIQFLTAPAYVTHLGSSNKHSIINVSSKPDRKGVRLVDDPRRRRNRGRPKSEIINTGVRTPTTCEITGEKRKRGRPKSDILNTGVRTPTTCNVCSAIFPNDREARRHYETEHPGTQFLKRYMCDVCGHTTKLHANLVNHMRVHTKEKPYACPHCDKRFTNQSNRDTHIVVHTGERKHECQHCGKRFSRASCVRLHIQTVHLKIPYPPWDKKNRRRRKELENAALPYIDE